MDKKQKQYKWITIASAGCRNRTRASPIQPYHDNQLIQKEFVFDIGKLLLLAFLTRALVQTCFLVLFCATLGSRVYVLPHACS